MGRTVALTLTLTLILTLTLPIPLPLTLTPHGTWASVPARCGERGGVPGGVPGAASVSNICGSAGIAPPISQARSVEALPRMPTVDSVLPVRVPATALLPPDDPLLTDLLPTPDDDAVVAEVAAIALETVAAVVPL